MKKIKAGLYIFFKSLTTPHYYKDLLEVDINFSFKYLGVLMFLAFMATFPSTAVRIVDTFDKTFNEFTKEVVNYFPNDLEINIKDGKLSTNTDKPYIVPVPKESEYVDNLIVVDPQGTIDDLEKYNTLFLVNESNIISQRSNKVKTFPLRDAPNTTITKSNVENFFNNAKKYLRVLPFIAVFVTAIVSAIIYFLQRSVLYLIPTALILQIFSIVLNAFLNRAGKEKKHVSLTFKKSYQIGIHAMTFPLVVEVIADVLEFPINAPFWFLLINLVFGIAGILYIAQDNISND